MNESVSLGTVLWKLAATIVFIGVNGFFVAAEFALVKARKTRIEALAERGGGSAQAVRQILGHLNLYLSACQLGITIASLILGWLAEPAVASLLRLVVEALGFDVHASAIFHVVSLGIALTVITVLHVILGEQVPKIWAIGRPEPTALLVGRPLRWFTLVLRPLIAFVNSASNLVLRLLGIEDGGDHEAVLDVDELRAILRAASRAGRISARQQAFGDNVLGLVHLEVRHIMLPRVDVVYVSTQWTAEQNLRIIRENRHSRFPVADPDLDRVAGIVHAKDLLVALLAGDEQPDLVQLARPIPSVPDTLLVSALIRSLQSARTHCAMVVDEHGTTVGMVFLEDALEEIVGPLHDEFDDEAPTIERISASVIEMSGSTSLPEAAKYLDLDLG
ncbi:MAG: HlyC/CorC family transporter, partial [Acidobacteria bacterium]|nr:HlyC/CorC family transporter [Acidobacteriota bacterium]